MTEPRRQLTCTHAATYLGTPPVEGALFVHSRQDISSLSVLLERERQARRDEVAIDLEDRNQKKGTPPVPSEQGDICGLRMQGSGQRGSSMLGD